MLMHLPSSEFDRVVSQLLKRLYTKDKMVLKNCFTRKCTINMILDLAVIIALGPF